MNLQVVVAHRCPDALKSVICSANACHKETASGDFF